MDETQSKSGNGGENPPTVTGRKRIATATKKRIEKKPSVAPPPYPSGIRTGSPSRSSSSIPKSNQKKKSILTHSESTITQNDTSTISPARSISNSNPELSQTRAATQTDLIRKSSKPSVKNILSRRRAKTSKNSNTLRRSSPNITEQFGVISPPSPQPVRSVAPTTTDSTDASQPPKKEILIFRVRLQDDNYKTLTIEKTTTAKELCDKLSAKLRKERPEQDWDGCELFESVGEDDIPVDENIVLSEVKEQKEFVFKRLGEKLANPEEILKQIIEERQQITEKKREIQCKKWFGINTTDFPTEDRPILYSMLDILIAFGDNPLSPEENYTVNSQLSSQIEALEDSLAQIRKKHQSSRRVRKKPKLYLDSTRVRVLRKIADAGGSYASIYAVSVDGMECAMKELLLDGGGSPNAFLTEIAVLEALPTHPSIVR